MTLADLTDPQAVQRAVEEYDRIGQDAFLAKYGFSPSRSYFLVQGGKRYDSKAVVGAAFTYQHGEPLRPKDFSGGRGHAARRLGELGFSVVRTDTDEPAYWALAVNPSHHRVLVPEAEGWWTTKGSAMKAGDGVVVWKYKGQESYRGIIAIGHVVGDPEYRSDTNPENWTNEEAGRRKEWRVPVELDRLGDRSLWIGGPYDALLHSLSASRAQGGTVFRLTAEQWKRLVEATGYDDVPPLPPVAEVRLRPVAEGETLRRATRAAEGEGERTPSTGGAGSLRRSRRAKVIGDRAEQLVYDYLKSHLPADEAATLRWPAREGETPGWDIEYTTMQGERIAVEVKGTVGEGFGAVELTAKEWKVAQNERQSYHLYLVARCESRDAAFEVVQDPAGLVEQGLADVRPSAWLVRFIE